MRKSSFLAASLAALVSAGSKSLVSQGAALKPYPARSSTRRKPEQPKFILLGREFMKYMKRYKSPDMPGSANTRKAARKKLEKRGAGQRREVTVAAQVRASDRDRYYPFAR